MIARTNHRNGLGPLIQLLDADNVDTREYHRHIGDVTRIDACSLFKSAKVLVAIRAEKAGLTDRGSARLDPATNHWHYTAAAENPEQDDWSVAATAVRPPRYESRFLSRAN